MLFGTYLQFTDKRATEIKRILIMYCYQMICDDTGPRPHTTVGKFVKFKNPLLVTITVVADVIWDRKPIPWVFITLECNCDDLRPRCR